MKPNMDIEYIQKCRLELDDTFDFKCRQCGTCCHNRDDLLLTGFDLYRISRHLGISPIEVFEKNCEAYIGDSSQIPVVRVLPKPHGGVCPFLRKGKCSVNEAKPIVCAVFPLARIHANDISNGSSEVFYALLNGIHCGDKGELHTVRNWLEIFNIPIDDENGRLWNEAVFYCSTFMNENKNLPESKKRALWEAILLILYFNYSTSKEFAPQIRENLEKIKYTINEIMDIGKC